MPHPFPQLAPPEPHAKAHAKARAKARADIRDLPALPWAEALVMLSIGLILLQI